MFNVGMIASRPSASHVKLTGRLVTGGGSATGTNVVLFNDGTHSVGTINAPVIVPGEWYVLGATASIGSAYQARFVVEAGSASYASAGAFAGGDGVWGSLGSTSSLRIVSGGAVGRYRIEIRDSATLAIRASAKFWTSGYEP